MEFGASGSRRAYPKNKQVVPRRPLRTCARRDLCELRVPCGNYCGQAFGSRRAIVYRRVRRVRRRTIGPRPEPMRMIRVEREECSYEVRRVRITARVPQKQTSRTTPRAPNMCPARSLRTYSTSAGSSEVREQGRERTFKHVSSMPRYRGVPEHRADMGHAPPVYDYLRTFALTNPQSPTSRKARFGNTNPQMLTCQAGASSRAIGRLPGQRLL